MKTSRLRRTTVATTTTLLLGLTLAACGDDADGASDDGSTSPSEPTSATTSATTGDAPVETPSEEPSTVPPPSRAVPSDEALAGALLRQSDVPAGFEPTPNDDEDDDSFAGTCLADVGEFEDALGHEPDSEAEVQYAVESEQQYALIGSKVTAYVDPDPVAVAFFDFTDRLQQCTEVSTTEDGITYDLDIAYDDTTTIPGTEQNLLVAMSGTITSGAESYGIDYQFIVSLADGYISLVGAYQLGADVSNPLTDLDALAEIQVARVAEVVG